MIAPGTPTRGLTTIEDALGVIFRLGRLPKVQEALATRAGVSVDRATYSVLGRIAQDGPVRLSALAAGLGLDLSTVSRHVQNLTDIGLVERTPDERDRRACAITISDEGRRVIKQLREASHATLEEALTEWSERDLDRLGLMLDRLAGDLDRYWKEH